jgi:hypothetical protein
MQPLNTPEGEKWLWREIEAAKPDAIVFDSIMCLLAGTMRTIGDGSVIFVHSSVVVCRNGLEGR